MLAQFTPEILAYCEAMTTPADPLLDALERETHLTRLQSNMVSGAYQGVVLSLISAMIRPKAILEIGTFTGYSALCMAKGLSPDGVLHTIEVNEEQAPIIQKYFAQSEYAAQLHLHIGDAKVLVSKLTETFDLVFIDADKAEYPIYLELILPKVRSGGIILVDNVLWYGKVAESKKDKTTAILHEFNTAMAKDERVTATILPIRDGVSLLVKK